jgi:hypothetical protein
VVTASIYSSVISLCSNGRVYHRPASRQYYAKRHRRLNLLRKFSDKSFTMKRFFSALVIVSFMPAATFAKGSYNLLPSAVMFPGLSGILFPSIPGAGGVNAAALPLAGKANAVQLSYSRSGNSGPEAYYGGTAFTSKSFGVSLGYLGSKIGNTVFHNTYAGAGFAIQNVSLGINVRSFNLAKSGATNDVDLGLIVGEGKGLTFGFVVYNLSGTAQVDVGIGFAGGKKYNMEFNFLLPPFSGGSHYAFTLAGTIRPVDAFGLHFKTSYFSNYDSRSSSSYQHIVGGTVHFSEVFGILFQYGTPNTWTGGVNLTF